MLTLSKKVDYALVALAEFAVGDWRGQLFSARQLSDLCGAPLPLLRNLLKALAKVGILESAHGPFGGYSLAKSPSEVTVRDVIEAIEGPIALTQCCGTGTGQDRCELASTCRIRRSIRSLQSDMVSLLANTTIESLVDGSRTGENSALGNEHHVRIERRGARNGASAPAELERTSP